MLGLDAALNELRWCTLDGREAHTRYDQLVLALGSVSRTLPIPGLAEHAVGFKTLADAIALRNRALLHLEIAESIEDAEKRREYLTFVFVGAGYAGVEGVAELQDMVADVIDRYPRCRIDGTRWILVERARPDHARDRTAAGRLRHRRAARPRHRGPDGHEPRVRRGGRRDALDRRADPDAHRVLDGRGGAAAARPRARPAARPRRADRGRADPARQAPREHLGDRRRGRGARPVGEAASGRRRRRRSTPLRQGRLVADNVASALGHGQPRPFRYKTRGVFVDMGRHKAVVSTPVVRFRGFPAWFAARTYHMLMMPGPRAKAPPGRGLDRRACSSAAARPSSASSDTRRRSTRRVEEAKRLLTTAQLTFREGTARDLAATFALAERALHEVAKRQGVMPEGVELTEAAIRSHWLAQRNMVEFLAAQPGQPLLDRRERRQARRASRASSRFGGMEELTELMVDPEYQREGVGRALLDRVWPGDPTPDIGRVVVATGASGRPHALPRLRRHARHRPLAPARAHGALPRAARAGASTRASRTRTCSPRSARARSGSGSSRSRSPTSAPRCTSSSRATARASRRSRPDGHATGLCWVSSHGEIGPAVGADAGGSRPGRAGGARPCGEDAGARGAQPVLHDDRLVAPAAAARARVLRLLAELDHVLGPAAGPRQVCTDAPAPSTLRAWPNR